MVSVDSLTMTLSRLTFLEAEATQVAEAALAALTVATIQTFAKQMIEFVKLIL